MKTKIEVKTVVEDAMYSIKKIVVTIPPFGPTFDMSELNSAFLKGSNGFPATLTDVEATISDRQAHLLDLGDAASEGSQYEDHFYQSIATRVDKIRELMAELDLKSEQVENLERIIRSSIRIGQVSAILILRHEHLSSVERSNKILQGSSAGGKGKQGVTLERRNEALECMKERVENGQSVSQAAYYAHHTRGHGHNPNANYKLYRRRVLNKKS